LATKNSREHHETNTTTGHENSPGLTQADGATKEQSLKRKCALAGEPKKNAADETCATASNQDGPTPHCPFTQNDAFTKDTTPEA
jgi:hypothetical protein